MRGKGINYDTGFINKGIYSRKTLDPEIVRREIQIIRDDLHCNAIRITGGDPDRLELASTLAAEANLEIWFSPFTCDLTPPEMLALLEESAARAERIRRRGAEVIFVAGAEICLLNKGFLDGETLAERMNLLNDPRRLRELVATLPPRINDFLGKAAATVRGRFEGKVTYAAIPFEGVDWTPFDVISVDLYRSAELVERFEPAVRALVAQGKPVAITEFGSTTYRGSAARGARGGSVIVWDHETVTPLRLDGEYVRDEAEQAEYVRELLQIFDAAGVDTTHVFTFASFQLPHRTGDRDDLDLGSYGLVKVLEGRRGETYPDMEWEPKAAFAAVAEHYRRG
jgi:hypothetical protein